MDGIYKENESKDGYKPCCGKCKKPFPDGAEELISGKNYPADGLIAIFIKCEDCGEESRFYYTPMKPINVVVE